MSTAVANIAMDMPRRWRTGRMIIKIRYVKSSSTCAKFHFLLDELAQWNIVNPLVDEEERALDLHRTPPSPRRVRQRTSIVCHFFILVVDPSLTTSLVI